MLPKDIKNILIISFLLTFISLMVSVGLCCTYKDPTPLQTEMVSTCSTTWKIGFGALLALLPQAAKKKYKHVS